jgi:hypothetical protein
MALHLHVFFPCALDFVFNLFLEIGHLVASVSINHSGH